MTDVEQVRRQFRHGHTDATADGLAVELRRRSVLGASGSPAIGIRPLSMAAASQPSDEDRDAELELVDSGGCVPIIAVALIALLAAWLAR